MIEQIDVSGPSSFLNDLLTSYGPKVVLALVALAAGWAIGRGLAWLVQRMVSGWGVGAAFKKTSIGRAILVSGYTPARFFGSLAKWCVYLITVYEATEVLAIPAMRTVMREIVLYLPYFISGLLILIVGFILSDLVGDIVKQAGGGSADAEYYNPFGDAVRIFLYFVVLVMALSQMKIDVTILYIFAQAFWSLAIAIGIAFGWNLKDRVGIWLKKMMSSEEKAKNTTQ